MKQDAPQNIPVTHLSRSTVAIAVVLTGVLLPSVVLLLHQAAASPFHYFAIPILLASAAISLWMAVHWKERRALPISIVATLLVVSLGIRLGVGSGQIPPGPLLSLLAEMLLWAAVPLAFASIAYLWRIFENQARFLHAQKALQESERRYRHLIENATDAFYTADANGCFTLVNTGAARMFDRRSSDLIGLSLFELVSDDVEQDIRTALTRQENDGVAAFYHEFPITARNGKTIWVGQNLQAIVEQRRLTGFQAVMRDMTEQHKAREDVRIVEFALDNVKEHVFMLNRDASIVYANKQALSALGYSATEIRSKTMHDIDGQLSPADWQTLWQAAKSGDGPTAESIHVARDGRTFPVVTSSSYFEFRGAGYIFAFVHDISREAELAAQLRQSQKIEAIGTLAGGIAHDFNNILSGIIGYTELSQGEAPSDGKLAVYLSEVKKAADRATDLVKQILTFSRSKETQHQPILLGPVVKEAVKLLRGSLPSTIEVRQRIDPQTSPVESDPVQIHQVVMNLCTNAYHAMREHGGVLDITLSNAEIGPDEAVQYLNVTPGSFVRLTVTDTGCGMDEETRRQMFEPFFTTKAEGEGTGLGMPTVLGIVRSHHGAIRVESEPGEGTRMTLLFPVCIRQEDAEGKPTPLQARPGTERILLVDDEEAIATSTGLALEQLGYTCRICRNGPDALDALREESGGVDILVTDYTMPGMTGAELMQAARTMAPNLPVILCTGRSPRIATTSTPTCRTLNKPYNIAALTALLREELDNAA